MIQKMLKYIQRKRDENMKELIVATTNQGKVKEIQAMLKDLNIEKMFMMMFQILLKMEKHLKKML